MWELKLKSIVMLTNVIEGASRMVSGLNMERIDVHFSCFEDQVPSILAGTGRFDHLRCLSSDIDRCRLFRRLRKTFLPIIKGECHSASTEREAVADRTSRLQIKGDLSSPPSSSITPIDDALSLSTINDDDQSRLVIQYHYTEWKDMDVPTDSHTLLHLIREVNEQTDADQYPIVVHCTYVRVSSSVIDVSVA